MERQQSIEKNNMSTHNSSVKMPFKNEDNIIFREIKFEFISSTPLRQNTVSGISLG
jgi:hypothetical protein